ncbi:MAG: nucleotidyl transferase [Gammaproteobacteria bacterium]|nr:nucleotidyl transferase [Gammaproteobacteria bacterium]
MLPVAILAGGLATRVQPLTARTPKSLLPIAGRPFLFHQLDLLRQEGVSRVVLCVGHLGEQIEAAAGDGRQFGLAIAYSFDGDRLLGTGGALVRALPLLGDDFFVMQGDSYLPCSFARLQSSYFAGQQPALMAILRNDNRWDRSNVLFKDGRLIEYDKHSQRSDLSHIDFGVSVFSRKALSGFAEDCVIDLADICRQLSLSGRLAAYEVSQRFYEIGSPQGIADTELYLSQRQPAA